MASLVIFCISLQHYSLPLSIISMTSSYIFYPAAHHPEIKMYSGLYKREYGDVRMLCNDPGARRSQLCSGYRFQIDEDRSTDIKLIIAC